MHSSIQTITNQTRLAHHRSSRLQCRSLPSIRDFIKNECPVRGWDGVYREQLRVQGDNSDPVACISVESCDHLVVPGQRRLYDVNEAQLERIISDQGKVLMCCFDVGDGSKKLAAPRKGSWACVGGVAGLKRHGVGGSGALVRVLVADRVAVQALDCSRPEVTLGQASLLRDRWAYFVRTAALEQHLSDSNSVAGQDVLTAVQQVQDACSELMQLLQQLAESVAAVLDAPDGSSSPAAIQQLQQLLVGQEAGDELSDILAWCQLGGPMDQQHQPLPNSSSSSDGHGEATDVLVPADSQLIERAWRLSFAPFAARGLAAALTHSSGSADSISAAVREALETTDLGMRLEAALELAQQWRSLLSAQLALSQLR